MASDFLNGRVRVVVGDITTEQVDAIVNAANSSLMGGGGVDGAIHRAGGPEILNACKRIRQQEFPNGLPTGEAAITTGGRLPAKRVIHTVGPIYGRNAGRDAQLLASCYRRSLEVAVEHGLETVAFPAISTGIYGYPPEEAAGVVSQAIEEFLHRRRTIREVRLVFFSARDAQAFVAHQRFTPHSSKP
jgi:O-acetyl-ADP-ribose deacetylase (regulator of RNase III)